MLKIGQTAREKITGYTSEGLGVCHIEGCAVFVPNAIRGEVCEIKVTHVSRNSAHGKIEQILERSPHRISRICPEAKRCGGCQLHHMDYAEELSFKAQKVTDALNRLGGQSLSQVPIVGAEGLLRTEIDHHEPEIGCAKADRQCQPAMPGEDIALKKEETDASVTCASVQANREQENARPLAVPPEAYSYRNKAQYPMATQNKHPVAGFYKNRTHEVIPVSRCEILPKVFDQIRNVVIRWAEENQISVYDEHTGNGLLRHIYVRRGTISGQIMVCLVVNGERLPWEQRLITDLQREIPGLSSVILSVNKKETNVVLGDRFRTLWGKDWIEDTLCGFTFRLSPRSFYQVNHDQAQRLYAKAVELAELHGIETVLDLYCGTGTITLALSRTAGKAVGVEVVPQAIEDAKENALRNGVTNVEFFCADAGEAAKRFADAAVSAETANLGPETPERVTEKIAPNDRHGRIDVIVVDPPRKGLAPEVLEAMVTMNPKRIVYVSCDPATLARDVKLLTGKGYTLSHAEAFDLFPRTYHVETVCLMSRIKD